MRGAWLAIFVLSGNFAFAAIKSAVRDPGRSYLEYKLSSSLFEQRLLDQPSQISAESAAVRYAGATLPAATAWESIAVMNARFAKMRDQRWMTTPDRPGFLRRASWLYPDDGCFARAALAVMNLVQWKFPAPMKIFVFGDLTVQTKNSPYGSVSWWFHVAPVVEVAGRKYVLDPATDPRQPQTIDQWLVKMSRDPGSLEVAVCQSGSYLPDDTCAHVTDGVESTALSDQQFYLDYEWERLVDLGRSPADELGDKPPWLSPLTN